MKRMLKHLDRELGKIADDAERGELPNVDSLRNLQRLVRNNLEMLEKGLG